MMRPQALLFSLLLSLPADAQDTQPLPPQTPVLPAPTESLVVFLGPHGGPGEIRLHDPITRQEIAAPAALRDLRLLPLDHVGRTELQEWLPDRPRWRDDVPGAGRLVLQGGAGSLYHYTRVLPSGLHVFGFLLLSPQGRPRRMLEQRGTGPTCAVDPYVGRVGVAPDGRSLLVATSQAAGGDLLELHLLTGKVRNRTTGLGPLEISDAGLWLHDDWGFGIASNGVVRFERAGASQATLVPFGAGPPPAWFSGEAVVSSSRDWALTAAGAGPQLQRPCVFGRSGPITVVDAQPGTHPGAGFLPESLDGPFMAITDNGELAGWIQVVPDPVVMFETTRELFCNHVAPPTPTSAIQVTQDLFFIDTFDEVGQVLSFQPNQLTFGVGERQDPVLGGIEGIDVYEVELGAGGAPQFQNRTLTSGATSTPFGGNPSITPDFAHLVPGVGLVLHDDDGGRILAWRRGTSGVSVLMPLAKDVDFLLPWQGGFLASVRRDFQPRPHELHWIPGDLVGPSQLIDPGAPDIARTQPTLLENDWLGYVMSVNHAAVGVARVHLPSGSVQPSPTGSGAVQPTLAARFGGGLAYVTGNSGGPNVFVAWPETGPSAALIAGGPQGFLLPIR